MCDAAPGASESHCSYTPPHCWPAPSDATLAPPPDTTRPNSRPSGGRSLVAPDERHGRRPQPTPEWSPAAAADAATTAAPTPRAAPAQGRLPPTDGATGPGTSTSLSFGGSPAPWTTHVPTTAAGPRRSAGGPTCGRSTDHRGETPAAPHARSSSPLR